MNSFLFLTSRDEKVVLLLVSDTAVAVPISAIKDKNMTGTATTLITLRNKIYKSPVPIDSPAPLTFKT